MKIQGLIKRREGAKAGAAALEFALLAPIFFLLMFAIIEAGAVFIGEAWLQYAVTDVGRQVRTGQVQMAGVNQTQFRGMVCARTSPFLPCSSDMSIDVKAYNDFTLANIDPPLDANGNLDVANLSYNPGNPCQVVVVRAYYLWSLQTPGFTKFLMNMGDDKRLLSAAAAMRNEPFSAAVNGC